MEGYTAGSFGDRHSATSDNAESRNQRRAQALADLCWVAVSCLGLPAVLPFLRAEGHGALVDLVQDTRGRARQELQGLQSWSGMLPEALHETSEFGDFHWPGL